MQQVFTMNKIYRSYRKSHRHSKHFVAVSLKEMSLVSSVKENELVNN